MGQWSQKLEEIQLKSRLWSRQETNLTKSGKNSRENPIQFHIYSFMLYSSGRNIISDLRKKLDIGTGELAYIQAADNFVLS